MHALLKLELYSIKIYGYKTLWSVLDIQNSTRAFILNDKLEIRSADNNIVNEINIQNLNEKQHLILFESETIWSPGHMIRLGHLYC